MVLFEHAIFVIDGQFPSETRTIIKKSRQLFGCRIRDLAYVSVVELSVFILVEKNVCLIFS